MNKAAFTVSVQCSCGADLSAEDELDRLTDLLAYFWTQHGARGHGPRP